MDNDNQELNITFIPLGKKFRPFIGSLASLLLISVIIFMVFAIKNEYRKGRYIGQEIEGKNSISVFGEGKVQAKPDIGLIDLGVLSEAATAIAAQKDNTAKMNKIIAAMKDLGIEEKDLKTADYGIRLKYQYIAGKSNIIGYEVNQTLEIKIRNLDQVGAVLGQTAEMGANQIGSLAFTFDDPEGLNVQARKKAINNAKERAGALAKDLGIKLVRIIDFSEFSPESQTPYYMSEALGKGGGEAMPQIETGQNEIVSNITITYEIE